jgi:hypothetical protein
VSEASARAFRASPLSEEAIILPSLLVPTGCRFRD